ncbi:hypothetical protein Moror_3941 [Moniliophthora roreri MCA 2997]|uniref:Uncharacterized protein n=1 Tax=Moniliophthora roreri (strain MCA 2997) TaxID=1381753 RepID=V2YUG5_MONRO|nr:hypothetical protein Moror_3941 [Moniliophthora roreri MCA 2997]
MAATASTPLPKSPRIKRKPPPRLDISERYPPPDPSDPFAPLSVLRSRSSALLGLPPSQENFFPVSVPCCRTSFQLYPASPTDSDNPFLASPSVVHSEYGGELTDTLGPPRKSTGGAHYRPRSQSIMGLQNAHLYSASLPHPLEPTPGLVRDTSGDSSGTDIESDYVPERARSVSPLRGHRNTSRGRLTHILRPNKKTSQMSINSSFSFSSSGSKTRTQPSLSSISISSPISLLASSEPSCGLLSANSNWQGISDLSGVDSLPSNESTSHARHPSDSSDNQSSCERERGHGYHSRPERSPSKRLSYRSAKQSLGSSTTKCTIIPNVNVLPSTPKASSAPVEGQSTSSPARSDNSCHSSSSYVNVSVPASVVDHGVNDQTSQKHSSSRRNNSAGSSVGASSSLFLPLSRPKPTLASPSTPALPQSKSIPSSPSSSAPLYRFPFRRSSSKARVTPGTVVAAPTKSSIRSLKISNPTLISPEPQIATRPLPGSTSSVSGQSQSRYEHSHSMSLTTDDNSMALFVAAAVASGLQPSVSQQPVIVEVNEASAATNPNPNLPPEPVPTSSSLLTPLRAKPEYTLPSPERLAIAASLPLITESGVRITLGSLLPRFNASSASASALIVVFVRHFWCPHDQEYVQGIIDYFKSISQNSAEQEQQLVIISNGSHTLISKYRQMFSMPTKVKVLTDPSLRVYEALGMHLDAEGAAPGTGKRGLFGGIATVVMRALKVGMPAGEKGGEPKQLGGEFVFSKGLTCTYAHRMQTSQDHAPVEELFQATGVLRETAKNSEMMNPMPPTSQIRPSNSPDPGRVEFEAVFTIPNHPYAHSDLHASTLPTASTPPFTHIRRRTESLSGASTKARKARVRASTIWSVDVKEYSADDAEPKSQDETEKWKRNLINLREGLGDKNSSDDRVLAEESTELPGTEDPANTSGTFSADFHERSLTSETTHDHDTAKMLEQTKELLMSRAEASNSLLGVVVDHPYANEDLPTQGS